MILPRKGQYAEVGRALGSVRPATGYLNGSAGNLPEFGRFFLSSAGLHLVLAWAVMTVGLHRTPLPEKPLVVRLVEAETPRASPPIPQPVRARQKPHGATDPSTEAVGQKDVAPRDLTPAMIGRPAPIASRAPEIAKADDPDERRQISSPRAAAELVKELGLSGGAALSSGVQIVDGARVDGPKAIGTPGRIAMAPGARAGAGSGSGPALIGDGAEGARQGSSGADGRGRARRLGAEITIPIAPTVTVGPRRGGSETQARAAGGGFARPDYGANPVPRYPPLAREKGYQGTVYIRAFVERDGRVGNLAVDRSSGYEILDRAAVESVREWTFLPAQKDQKPVASWVLLPVKFVLK